MRQRRALELTLSCKPIGTRAAREMGFLDDAFGEDTEAFEAELRERARHLARDPEFRLMLREKHETRLDDEYVKPLASYRAKELARMRVNFFGPAPPITRPAGALSSKGIRRRSGTKPRSRQHLTFPPGFSQREEPGPALASRPFRDLDSGSRLIRPVREWGYRLLGMPRRQLYRAYS